MKDINVENLSDDELMELLNVLEGFNDTLDDVGNVEEKEND